MKILLFTENYWRGGMDTFIAHLLNNWPEARDSFYLSCNSDHPGLIDLKSISRKDFNIVLHEQLTFVSFWKGCPCFFRWKVIRPLQVIVRFFFFLKHIVLFRKFLTSIQPEQIMIINGSYPGGDTCRALAIAAWMKLGIKPIHNLHNNFYPYPAILYPFEGMIDWLVRKSTSHWITVSQSCAETKVNRRGFNIPIHVIYNGIADVQSTTLLPQNKQCLMLGNYEPRKGHLVLIDAVEIALKDDPDLHFVCAGHSFDDDYKMKLKAIISEKKLEHAIELRDYAANSRELIQNAYLIIQPSIHSESFGLVLLEAMREARPIIVSNVGGMKEVLAGWSEENIFPNENAEELANCILRLVKYPEIAKQYAEAGRKVFLEKFTARNMAKNYFSFVRGQFES